VFTWLYGSIKNPIAVIRDAKYQSGAIIKIALQIITLPNGNGRKR